MTHNPLIGDDPRETATSVQHVLEFLASQRCIDEETMEVADGRRLVLETCSEALATIAR